MDTQQQIPKEQLRKCPYCGGQIPLVSNECLYCGKSLTNITKSADEVTPNDEEEIKNCPDCGAPFPLLSNICTSCGHVLHQQRSSEINITNLLAGIRECIHRIENLPKPTLFQTVIYWIFYIIIFIDVAIFIYSLIFDSVYCRLFSLCGLIGCGLATIFLQHKKWSFVNTKSPVQIADEEYYKARYAHEMYLREVEAFYGDNKEAQKLLNDYSVLINNLRNEKNKNRAKIYTIISLFVIAFIASIFIIKHHKSHPTVTPITVYDTLYVTKNEDAQKAAINDFAKHLMPYPPNIGVSKELEEVFKADHYADITFVVAHQTNNKLVYRWKVNNVKISGYSSKDSLGIILLDKDHNPITGPLSESVKSYFRGKFKVDSYEDFWSVGVTSSIDDLKKIADEAMFYTITAEQ